MVDRLVSIVVPAYKAAHVIGHSIDSVREQSYQSWELIVIDDCSPDATGSVVRELCRLDPRIRLLTQERNAGPAAARRVGLSAASGKLVAFLDADDSWLPCKLERQVAFMENQDAALSYTGFRRTSSDGGRVGRLIEVPQQLRYTDLLKNTAIATSTVMVDLAKTGPLKVLDTYYDDFVLWLSILSKGFVAHGLGEDLMRYRVLEGSVSRNKWNSARWVWHTYRKIEGLAPPYALWCFVNYAWNGARKYTRF